MFHVEHAKIIQMLSFPAAMLMSCGVVLVELSWALVSGRWFRVSGVHCRTEGGEAPGWHDAKMASFGSMRPTSNAARPEPRPRGLSAVEWSRDASPAERKRSSETQR